MEETQARFDLFFFALQRLGKKSRTKKRGTSLQLAGVGLVFLHDLSDLLPFQRGVQHLVQPGVSLPAVDEFHELVQRDKWLPLGAAAAERNGSVRALR